MTGKYFRFSDVLSYGWNVMKTCLGFFVGLGIVWLVITNATTIINTVLRRTIYAESFPPSLRIFMIIASWIIGIVIGIGITKIALSFCDERKPAFSTLFNASWNCFWRYLAAGILYMLIFIAGLILLIVPGVIWSVKFGLWPYFVVDKGLGPIQALKASSRTTMGVKWDLFGFGVLCAIFNLAGLLCLIVGVFVTYPTIIVAHALVYRQLAAQTPELVEFGINQTPTEYAQVDITLPPDDSSANPGGGYFRDR
jgi:uncharacterized membrane protein